MAGRAATPQGRKLNNIINMPDSKYKLFCTFCKVKLPIDWTMYANENVVRVREYQFRQITHI
jgi:hypothetical protein